MAQQQFQIEYAGGGGHARAILPMGNSYFMVGTADSSSESRREGLLLKLAADGGPIWTKAIGGRFDDELVAIEATHDGNMILLGSTQSFVGSPTDARNIYLVLIDTMGQVLRSKSIGTIHGEVGYAVHETADHGFIVVGTTDSSGVVSPYLLKTDNQLGLLWSRVYRNPDYDVNIARSVVELSGGGYALTGNSTQTTAAPEHRLFFLTTDADGMPVASHHYAFTDHTNYVDWGVFGEDILQNAQGNLVIVGGAGGYYNTAFQDIYSPLLMEISPSGSLVHSNSFFLNSGNCRSMRVAQTTDGGYVLGGIQGNDYLSMFKVDGNINTQWSYYYADNFIPQARGYSVRTSSDGGYLLSGSLSQINAMRVVKTNAQGQSGCAEAQPFGAAASSPIGLAESTSNWTAFAHADTAATYTIAGGIPMSYAIVCGVVGSPELSISQLAAFPNPCTNQLSIRAVSSGKVLIRNVLGEVVAAYFSDDSLALVVDMTRLAAGVYFVQCGGEVVRVVKE